MYGTNINAKVVDKWNGTKCKFLPGDRVKFRGGYSIGAACFGAEDLRELNEQGADGIVIARTLRVRNAADKERTIKRFKEQWNEDVSDKVTNGYVNRYYVYFPSAHMTFGIDSSHIEKFYNFDDVEL